MYVIINMNIFKDIYIYKEISNLMFVYENITHIIYISLFMYMETIFIFQNFFSNMFL
jgi:hypothetical protein